jgi:hypothetical protein
MIDGMGSLCYDVVRTLSPFRYYLFLYVKDQRKDPSFQLRSCTTINTAQAWAGPTSIPRGAV